MERKLPYEEARVDVIFIDNTDIVTTSNPNSDWNGDTPGSNMDGGGWTTGGNGVWD